MLVLLEALGRDALRGKPSLSAETPGIPVNGKLAGRAQSATNTPDMQHAPMKCVRDACRPRVQQCLWQLVTPLAATYCSCDSPANSALPSPHMSPAGQR